MGFERAVQAWIIHADMTICAALPVIVGLLLFGAAAFLIIKTMDKKRR